MRALTPKTRLLISIPLQPDGRRVLRRGVARAAIAGASALVVVLGRDLRAHLVDGRRVRELRRSESGLYDRTLTVNGMSKGYAMSGWRSATRQGPRWPSKR